MPDSDMGNTQDVTPNTPEPQDGDGQNEAQDTASLPKWARDAITRANAEAAKYRIERQKEHERAAAEERKRLADEQKWKELAEKLQADLAQAKPEIEAAQAYRATIAETVKARVDALPEQYRSLVPDYDDPIKTLRWLDANAARLQAPRVPDMDAGVTGDVSKSIKLTSEELQLAKAAGMTPQQFAEYKTNRPQSIKLDQP